MSIAPEDAFQMSNFGSSSHSHYNVQLPRVRDHFNCSEVSSEANLSVLYREVASHLPAPTSSLSSDNFSHQLASTHSSAADQVASIHFSADALDHPDSALHNGLHPDIFSSHASKPK